MVDSNSIWLVKAGAGGCPRPMHYCRSVRFNTTRTTKTTICLRGRGERIKFLEANELRENRHGTSTGELLSFVVLGDELGRILATVNANGPVGRYIAPMTSRDWGAGILKDLKRARHL